MAILTLLDQGSTKNGVGWWTPLQRHHLRYGTFTDIMLNDDN